MEPDDLKILLSRVASGELSTEDAFKAIRPPKRTRKRKQTGKPGGRPRGAKYTTTERFLFIANIWVLFSDKISKMELRAMIANAFCLSDPAIGAAISKINKLSERHIVARHWKSGTVLFLTHDDYHRYRQSVDMPLY